MRTVRFEQSGGTVSPVIATSGRGPHRPRGSDVLVRVAASSINGTDIGLRRSSGLMAVAMKRSTPGFDVAGHVVACGDQVTAFEIGDHVMGLLDHSGGGQADYVVVAESRLAVTPSTMSPVEATAIPLAGLTALQGLRKRGRLRTGSGARVLINGAAGGIGSFAVQLSKIFGAHVTATSSSARHGYLVTLGADRTLDRGDPTLFDGTRRFDVIFDTPGVLRLTDVRAALDPGGRLVTTHPITADMINMIRPPWRPGSDPRVAAVTTSASGQDLAYLARLVQQGRLTVPIDEVYPLAEVRDAYDHAERGDIRGKIVLTL